jgi:glycosyltransferase involved in cell wall biosynthesis
MLETRHPPDIRPVNESGRQPLWSVMIPTYNCASLLRETLSSILGQDPGHDLMQIEVVDDCSTLDDPKSVVENVGPGRVAFFRQPENVGHVINFNTCLERARGCLIHLLHGDDLVRPGFYEQMGRAFEEAPEIGAVFCRPMMTNESGDLRYLFPLEQRVSGPYEGGVSKLAVKQRIVPPSIAVRRNVYVHLGGFDPRIQHYGEDWEMWVRIAAHYPLWYETEPLGIYRLRQASLSGTSMRTGENLRDVARTIELFEHHLPPSRALELTAKARKWAALQAIKNAKRLGRHGDAVSAWVQFCGAFRLSKSSAVYGAAVTAVPALLRGAFGAAAFNVRDLPGRGPSGDASVSQPPT